jgi:putative transposase
LKTFHQRAQQGLEGYAMDETTAFDLANPVGNNLDREVANFREQFDGRALLDQLVRQGAQQMLQKAVEAEVAEFLQDHQDRRDEHGNRLVVGNG